MQIAVTNIEEQRVAISGYIDESMERDILRQFRDSLDGKEATKDTYSDAVRAYFKWIRLTGRRLDTLTSDDIVAYKSYLLNGPRKHSDLTTASYLIALKKFYAWVAGKKAYPDIAASVALPKINREFVKMPLTLDQCGELLDHAEATSKRDYALIYLMLNSGLRTIEVTRLNREDIDTEHVTGQHILWIHGKGHNARDKEDVVISEEVFSVLSEYIATTEDTAVPDGDGTPLFVGEGCLETQRGNRLTPRRVQSICKEGMRAIGLDSHQYSAHSLRHTFAVNRIRNKKASMEDTKMALRHKSIDTTHYYTHTIEKLEHYEKASQYFLDDLYKEHRKGDSK